MKTRSILLVIAVLLSACGIESEVERATRRAQYDAIERSNGAAMGQRDYITVSGPDKHGVVCYSTHRGLSCVKVN